jgi:hypothetical protein
MSPPDAARELGYSGSSRFRSVAYHDPEFAVAYRAAKRARHRLQDEACADIRPMEPPS